MDENNKKVMKETYEWIKDIIIALAVTLFIINFVFQNTQVVGDSMDPTLHDGNAIIINKFIYRFHNPSRGDIIAFEYAQNPSQYFIKRVIGIEGDIITIHEGKVYLNGKLLNEKYILESMDEAIIGNIKYPITVPKDHYFVMGDNRNISYDSRYSEVGLIPISNITGKAILRIWPLNNISLIE